MGLIPSVCRDACNKNTIVTDSGEIIALTAEEFDIVDLDAELDSNFYAPSPALPISHQPPRRIGWNQKPYPPKLNYIKQNKPLEIYWLVMMFFIFWGYSRWYNSWANNTMVRGPLPNTDICVDRFLLLR
ncbi:myristoylated tegument protein [Macropodid alphaherpesvirus 2]|uniref:Myristoylated tegument protein n=1 Tax=Macropodid alphaherpesvirus 2 TaxID=83440 RepID=A0AAE7MLP1_9ALPH|nr:myristoylated tegument protein [Macropodid alphaherpesvirus 2]QOD40254.1 myristoylated tegument protein [Macropodid alphaherpesvirus 2]